MSYSSLSAEELVRACAESGNTEAWEEFVRRFRLLIGSVVRRIARRYGEFGDTFVDDLIQDTYLKVCDDGRRMLRDFKPQHQDAFFGMLKVTAANLAHDHFRRKKAIIHGGGISEVDLADVEGFVPGSHSDGPAHIEREILLREIDEILRDKTDARDREIFWLHYRLGFTAKAIAAIPCYKLTTKGVESALYRLTGYVRDYVVDKCPEGAKAQIRSKGISPSNTLDKREGQR
jgi:RNA polymerase sigma factor (sigma-70 family)